MLSRILTAIVLIPLVVWAVLFLPINYFATALGGVALLSLYEWYKLFIRFSKQHSVKFLFGLSFYLILGVGLILLALSAELYHYQQSIFTFQILTVFWGGIFLWMWLGNPLKSYPKQIIINHSLDSIGLSQIIWLMLGYLVIIGFWLGLMTIRTTTNLGSPYILGLLVFVWLADSGAYFVGKAFGRTKIFPKGSPNKTLAGFFGGYLSAVCIAVMAFYYIIKPDTVSFFQFVSLASILYFFSVYGDLFESVIKRLQGVKDSGQLLPGHGGILDRLDSLYATVPIYTLMLLHYLT